MADLIAIGYPDETTADAAADEARRLAQDLIIQPDAIAVIVRDKEGKFHTHTSHHLVGGGATWGMFWGPVGLLFFIGPGDGRRRVRGAHGQGHQVRCGKAFQDQVRDLLQPGPRRCSSWWRRSPRTRPSMR
jgi:hypothetical protein